MLSQIDLLKKEIPRLTALAKDGADNPFVKGLTQQLAGLESQQARRDERQERIERYLLGGGEILHQGAAAENTGERTGLPLNPAAGRGAGQVVALPLVRPPSTKSRVSMFVMTRRRFRRNEPTKRLLKRSSC